MATTTFFAPAQIGTTTNLNTYYGGLSAAIVAVGCTRVAGTVTWGSVAFVNTPGYNYGYEVFKLNTPPTGGTEVYFRIDYLAGNVSAIVGDLRVSTGTGWNSGTSALTGPGSGVAATRFTSTATNADSVFRQTIVSCDGDGIVIAGYYLGVGGVRFLLLIDRQRDSNGVAAPPSGFPTPSGYCRYSFPGTTVNSSLLNVDCAANAGAGETSTPTGGLWPTITRGDLTASKSMLTTAAPAGVMPTYPTWIATRNGTYASKLVVVYSLVDVPVGTDLTVLHLGANRHYTALGGGYVGLSAYTDQGAAAAIWVND